MQLVGVTVGVVVLVGGTCSSGAARLVSLVCHDAINTMSDAATATNAGPLDHANWVERFRRSSPM